MNAHAKWLEGLTPKHDSMDSIHDASAEIRQRYDVRPSGEATPEHEKTLLDVYAASEEIASVRAAHAQIAVAEEDVRKIQSALVEVSDQLAVTRRLSALDADRAAAMALGEAVPESPARSGHSLSLLQAQKIGLERRAEAARAAVNDAKGKFRAAVFDLVRQCAIRCAQDFYDLSRQQAWCWLQMDIAQSLTGGPAHRLVDLMTWNKYLVPGSEHIEVLKQHSRAEWGQVVLMSADGLRASARPALEALREHAEKLFGSWPL